MMGIETLIKRLNQYSQSLIAYKLGADFADTCMDAAAVLSKLQTENKKLRAELEKVMRERDAAQSLLAERIGVRGAEPITTAFGLPIDRLRELAQADREGLVHIIQGPDSGAFVCGNCRNFIRNPGTRVGVCTEQSCYRNHRGNDEPWRGTFSPSQSRKACRKFVRAVEEEKQ